MDENALVVGVSSPNNPDCTFCIEHNPMNRADLFYVELDVCNGEVCTACGRPLQQCPPRRLYQVELEELERLEISV
jgi:Na+-translocating ferredoxin:NAD+ oxidoreductase RNF subunit RnfB